MTLTLQDYGIFVIHDKSFTCLNKTAALYCISFLTLVSKLLYYELTLRKNKNIPLLNANHE
ncbi:MAG: hypothetical protein ABI723_01560, partial [Bacteroidia bacterium]